MGDLVEFPGVNLDDIEGDELVSEPSNFELLVMLIGLQSSLLKTNHQLVDLQKTVLALFGEKTD